MKTFTKAKAKAKSGKGGKAKVIDGRANPAALDPAKHAAFLAACGIDKAKALPPKLAQQMTATVVRQQNGKGVRMVRENANGYPKTRLIWWASANGYDRADVWRAIGRMCKMMVPNVFAKAWRKGETDGAPDTDPPRETIDMLKRLMK